MFGYAQTDDKFLVKAYVRSYVDGNARDDLAQIVGPLTLCYAEELVQTLSTLSDNKGDIRYSKVEVVFYKTM